MDLNEIIEKLKNYDGTFPRLALYEAIKNKEKIAEELLKLLRYSIDNIKNIKDDEDFMGHIFSMFLLAQFREKKAFPLIIEFFTALKGHDYDFCSEFIAEDLPRILASVYDGSFAGLKELIENNEINEWIRTAFLQSIQILYLYEDIGKKELLDYYRELFKKESVFNDKYLFDALVQSSIDLSLEELFDNIAEGLNKRKIKIINFTIENLKYMFSRNKEEVVSETKSLTCNKKIDNVILEMEDWACFIDNNKG